MLQWILVESHPTQDLVRFYHLPAERIVHLIFLLEGYEGWAVPRTLDKEQGIVELLIAPDFLPELTALLNDLQAELEIAEIPKPRATKSKSILDP